MRLLKTLIAVGVLGAVAAGPAWAQATPPAQPPTKPTTPAPPTGQPPTTPAPAPPAAAAAPRPYPEGAKIAYVDIQAIASGSVEGKAATSKLQELEKKKVAEITAKNKQLEDARNKQQTSSTIMNDSSRLALEKEVDKLTREVQFLQQEAQADRNALQTELQVDFQRKLNPILEQVAKEKGLHLLLDIQNSGAVWVDTGLDLTAEVIKRLDASKSAPPPVKK
jgi:Skp family chaperone for outer membrane proteins